MSNLAIDCLSSMGAFPTKHKSSLKGGKTIFDFFFFIDPVIFFSDDEICSLEGSINQTSEFDNKIYCHKPGLHRISTFNREGRVVLFPFLSSLGKQQKRYFFSGPTTKALTPSPSSLVVTFFV